MTNPIPLDDKNPREIRNIRGIPKHSKDNLQQDGSQHQIKWRETQNNSTNIRYKARLSTLSIPIQYSTEALDGAMTQPKEIKGTQIGEEEVKLSVCR